MVRGCGCDIKPLAPANFLEAPEMAGARQQHMGWCTIRKEACEEAEKAGVRGYQAKTEGVISKDLS